MLSIVYIDNDSMRQCLWNCQWRWLVPSMMSGATPNYNSQSIFSLKEAKTMQVHLMTVTAVYIFTDVLGLRPDRW